MSRILLADDSPHAQRMGERILREEGFEVVTVTDGETAVIRLRDVDPDVLIADVGLPRRSGYELCEYLRSQTRHRHARVILTAGLLEPLDEERARAVRCDTVLRKPFEASAVIEAIKPLAEAARLARGVLEQAGSETPAPAAAPTPAAGSEPAPADPERVRAAVTLALDAALPAMIDEITRKVLVALEG